MGAQLPLVRLGNGNGRQAVTPEVIDELVSRLRVTAGAEIVVGGVAVLHEAIETRDYVIFTDGATRYLEKQDAANKDIGNRIVEAAGRTQSHFKAMFGDHEPAPKGNIEGLPAGKTDEPHSGPWVVYGDGPFWAMLEATGQFAAGEEFGNVDDATARVYFLNREVPSPEKARHHETVSFEGALEEIRENRKAQLDVYRQRNVLALALARAMYDQGNRVRWDVDPASPEWPVLLIWLTGFDGDVDEEPTQISYHLEPGTKIPGWIRQADEGERWDGHSDAAKARRLAKFTSRP